MVISSEVEELATVCDRVTCSRGELIVSWLVKTSTKKGYCSALQEEVGLLSR